MGEQSLLTTVVVLQIIGKRLKLEGFIIGDHFKTHGPDFKRDMSQVSC